MRTKLAYNKTLLLLILFCIIVNQTIAASFPVKSEKITYNRKMLTGIEDILRSANPVTMQTIIQNQDSVAAMAFYNSLGSQIAAYLENVYGENFSNELEDMPQAMVVLGMFRWGLEHNVGPLPEIPEEAFVPDDDKYLACFVGAVNGLIGLRDVVSLYNEFKAGASAKTILRGLKVALGRVATVFTIVTSVLGLGSCLGWW